MQDSPFKKLLLLIVLAATAVALVLQFVNSRFKPQAELPAPKIAKAEIQESYPPLQSKAPVQVQTPADDAASVLDQLKIPRDKAEAWLAKHNRNAASLLAAFRALDDTNYLNEAATNFPDNPQVQLAVLSQDAFPEDRRKWLDLFKASSPDNSLADYLSAEAYFKDGKTDTAVQELLTASGKSSFQSYTMEAQLNAEELAQFSGKTPEECVNIGLSAAVGDVVPLDGKLKQATYHIMELQKEKASLGDASAVQDFAAMGLTLSDQIRNGDSGKLLINQLVGNATEAVVLSQLDQSKSYEFLGGQTPGQALQNLKDQKVVLRELINNCDVIKPGLSVEEQNAYFQRMKIYGELEAMKWLVQQHPPAVPQQ